MAKPTSPVPVVSPTPDFAKGPLAEFIDKLPVKPRSTPHQSAVPTPSSWAGGTGSVPTGTSTPTPGLNLDPTASSAPIGDGDYWQIDPKFLEQQVWFANQDVQQDPFNTELKSLHITKPVTQSVRDILKQYAALALANPAKFRALQQQLETGDFADGPLKSGFKDDTEKALETAIKQYLRAKDAVGAEVSFTDFLGTNADVGAQQRAEKDNQKAAASQPTMQLTDPAQLHQVVSAAFKTALDRDATPEEVGKFVEAFQSQQRMAYTNAVPGGTVVQPDVQAQAMQFAKDAQPIEYQDHQTKGFVNALMNELLPSGFSEARFAVSP